MTPTAHHLARTECAADGFTHPLLVFPLFRRWPRSQARDLFYTLIWNSLLALVFTGLALVFDPNVDLGDALRVNMTFAQCIGFVIHGLMVLSHALAPRLHEARVWLRWTVYTVIPTLGVFLGYWIGAELLGYRTFLAWLATPRGFGAVAVLSLLISAVLMVLALQRERTARAEAAVALEQARVADAERASTLAQLKALEAQVEPHFLYNTLAHVASMIESEPAQARAMLDQLIALLRSTAQATAAPTTLGGQADLLRAWLDILALRMGPRLKWSIDVPRELRDLPLPPALLQPLVENAIKHGLEPNIAGGTIEIAASRFDDTLELTVADTGAGFDAARAPLGGSTALGLANLRARLAALYGTAGTLALAENRPRGVRASLRIPLPPIR